MPKPASKLSERLADILKGSGSLTFTEQVACVAALEIVLKHWNAALANDIQVVYGAKVQKLLQEELKK